VTRFLFLVRHGEAPGDGELSDAGREQARLTGERLRDVPFGGICHGPLPRAAQTAELIAASLPGVPVSACDLAGDYLPSDPDPAGLPPSYARFVARFSAAERAEGPERAEAALDRFARPGGADGDEYELLVTHNFLAGWLVSQAMAAPPWRWLGVNQMNCAISVIAYQAGLPASLLTFNDAAHLSPELRWTGFPPTLRFLPARCATRLRGGHNLPVALMFLNGDGMRGGRAHYTIEGVPLVGERHTGALYRFFSVRDEFPALYPVADGGQPIAGELYDVPMGPLSALLATEPPELELSIIELEDGELSFAMVLRQAEHVLGIHKDITSYGGWRAYREATRPPRRPA
jgi:serine/threonine-protein phosphatase PGAM5